MDVLRDYRDNYSPYGTTLQLAHFRIYGARLKHIQRQMNDWRPQTVQQLRKKGYRDPMNYYLFWFSIFIGVIAVLGFGATLAQTYASVKILYQ